MIIHADALPEGEVLDADVCVVGAGPVGIQLARRLARRGVQVVVVESGEEDPVARAQDLNEGTVSGLWSGALREIRIRRLGGTMHVWGGNCRPLDPIDFEVRDWVPGSGWPVTHAEVAPYMADAHDALLLDAFDYHAGDGLLRQRAAGADGAPFDEIRFKLSRLVPGTQAPYLGEYAEFLRAELKGGANPRFVTGATVCQILLSEDRRRIEGLFALTFQGRELHLRAKAYVLATGGIETARLLLASREDMACGVGNEGDSVGRYFMEHPHGLGGLLLVHDDALPALRRFSPGDLCPTSVTQRRLRLSDAVQRRLRLLNLSFQLVATGVVPTEQDRYAAAFARLETSVEDPARWHRYYIIFLSEQAPSRDSRVTLGTEEDFFGLPRPDLCWRVGQQDYDTVRTALDLLRTEVFDRPEFRMERRIAARLEDWVIGYGAHHIGTARMSRSAQDGVVDRDCRIHGLANGFCAGSAVFSTAGMANPVLASIALAMRLGDHLVARLPSLPPAETAGQMRRPAIYALA